MKAESDSRSPLRVLPPHLHNEGLSGGPTADDGLGDVVALCPSLVVQHGAGDGLGHGEVDQPVAVEVVFAPQVLDGCRWDVTSQSLRGGVGGVSVGGQ